MLLFFYYSNSVFNNIVDVCGEIGLVNKILLTSFLLCSNHRGLRHYWGLRVRGQHTKTTGRRGKTVGVSKKR